MQPSARRLRRRAAFGLLKLNFPEPSCVPKGFICGLHYNSRRAQMIIIARRAASVLQSKTDEPESFICPSYTIFRPDETRTG
jgi:hypothetical protein